MFDILKSMHVIIASLLISFFFISTQVREKILLSLCQHPYWSSPENVTDLVINNSSEFRLQIYKMARYLMV